MESVTGILLLDKPLGLSSNHALQRVRRMLGADKAGHVGSLDPLATGMLPICLGEATKIAGEIISQRKRYRFTVKLGERTATGDVEGAVVERCEIPQLDEPRIEAALAAFRGPQRQVPPMYSAIKKDGQPLYKLARAGQEVEREAREIEIHELICTGRDEVSLQLEALCSKGTYVRVLAEDLARALGSCGHVTALRRLYVEPFEGEPMETLESIEQGAPRILPADRGIPEMPALHLSPQEAQRLRHGQEVPLNVPTAAGKRRLYDGDGSFMGIGEVAGQSVRPRRLWVAGVRE